ncbi:GyrI-like domain-containing protein [Algoriphagus antarcticus]|uniref:AraC family transcriptional regulator n=1 Tax=Algoriphagus antarcticus TaxID=238540 RepID=A0A3E0E3K1_9BACT|nr:GyrI-like domain-containing protein [Algoriphagus antarcticus]REG92745.1 AraC family transcriptional regulator [Algoriphagus antarcticus]
MNPSIKTLPDTKLIGMRIQMNFIANKTQALWQKFMPRRKEIEGSVFDELYSVEIYSNLSYFESFNPASEFEKWAAVKVEDFEIIPEEMEKLFIPAGLYAVFPFKGLDSDAPKMYQYIIESWIPESIYELDHRPHFALMGDNYKNNDPDSEEEFWVPIKHKSDD